MSLESAVSKVEEALRQNRHCSSGLMARKGVFGIRNGPSGGPEILTLIYADDQFFGYWYGHVVWHPKNENVIVSLLVWTSEFINAPTVPLLFRRFHYWIRDRLKYRPCSVQNADDAYRESGSIEEAANSLAKMIGNFDIDKRCGDEYGPYAISPPELRILGIYGLADTKDSDGCYPPIPMPTPLTAVGIPE